MTSLGVVVPARNEAALLPSCLAALSRSREVLRHTAPEVSVRVIVVLDSCVDGSAGVVRSHPQVESVPITAGCVGQARQAGIDQLLRTGRIGPIGLGDWFACTDADSTVPEDWLITHHEAARDGIDLLLGTVRPRPDQLSETDLARWRARHDVGDGHPHVFGANLGLSRRALTLTGGFRPLPVHEDSDLATRVRAAGLSVRATAASPVLTSARRSGRAPGGFATYLAHEFGAHPDQAAAG